MLVKAAHLQGIRVVPLVGPSSLLLALMASGFNGQSFAFHGYLPIEEKKRDAMIRQLEGESARHDRTQMFMEAPYRNNSLFKAILSHAGPETRICVAADLTLPEEYISTKRVIEWKKEGTPDLNNRPVMFLLYAR
jgi:16S rRNA (cytidine1402-2'-O)-methyltransferase